MIINPLELVQQQQQNALSSSHSLPALSRSASGPLAGYAEGGLVPTRSSHSTTASGHHIITAKQRRLSADDLSDSKSATALKDATPATQKTESVQSVTVAGGDYRGQAVSAARPPTVISGSSLQIPYRYHCRISMTDYCVMTLSIPLLFLRLMGIAMLLISGWIISRIALRGIDFPGGPLYQGPLTGWRYRCQRTIRFMGRLLFFACGLQWVKLEGHVKDFKRRGPEGPAAPLLVVAPHISYLDAFLVTVAECSIVSRSSLKNVWIFGPIVQMMQPIFVDREDSKSRVSTVEAIKTRTNLAASGRWIWPPIFVFPEGTTSNGLSLLRFKSGAFIPGQPVQVIGIRYHTWMRSFQPCTMTWDTNYPVWKACLCILLQPHISATVTVFGVYRPSLEEQRDPHGLFTDNVQRYLAMQLDMPATDYTYQHAKAATGGTVSSTGAFGRSSRRTAGNFAV